MNLVQENVKKLKEIFPEIFVEGEVNLEILSQILNGGGCKIQIILRRDIL